MVVRETMDAVNWDMMEVQSIIRIGCVSIIGLCFLFSVFCGKTFNVMKRSVDIAFNLYS